MLCQAGVRPRVLLHDPARLDADYVAAATEGVDAIFWVHPDDWSLRAATHLRPVL